MSRTAILALAITLFTVGGLCGWGLRSRTRTTRQANPELVSLSDDHERASTPEVTAASLSPDESVKRLQQIASERNGTKRSRAVAAIADNLNEAQILAALAELQKIHLRERDEITALLIARWAKLNPQAAIEYANSIKVATDRDAAIRAAVTGWAETDLAPAKKWVLGQSGPKKDAAQRGLIEAIAVSDPKAAFALIQEVNQMWSDSLAENMFDQWTMRDPREAADHAAQLPKGGLRDEAMDVVASRWASADLTSALEWAEKMWDQKLSRADTGTRFPPAKDAMTAVLQTWLEQDANAAIRWIQELPDKAKGADLMKSLLAVAADRDPSQAAELITSKLPPGKLQDKALTDLAFRWSFGDETEAIAWVERQTNPEIQQLFLSKLAFQMRGDNGKAVVALAEKVGGPQKEGTISMALQGWAGSDPAAASAWVDKQTANWRYYDSVAYRWGRKDPQAATAWVNALPPGPAKDRFLQEAGVAVNRKYIEPVVGTQWIAEISDPTTRTTAYTNLARAWLERDTEAARAWLANAPLDQNTKNELLKTNAR